MSEMDWEASSQTFPPQQNVGQLRCPYRASSDTASNYQIPIPQPQALNTSMPFNPTQPPPQRFWDNVTQQNLPSHEGMSNRFAPIHSTSNQPGRAPEIASFDYNNMGQDGQSHHSTQTRHSRFEGNRSLLQRSGSYPSGTQQNPMAGNGAGLSGGSNQSTPSSASDLGLDYNALMARRNISASASSHENGSTTMPTSPNRHLPPPNSVYHGLFVPQHVPYHHQPRFSSDRSGSIGPQRSTSSMPPHPPPMFRDPNWARRESGSQNAPHPNWFHEALYATPMGDVDSDDDSTEAQEESLRRQGRLDSASTLHLLHESMRLSGGHRRVNPAFDAEGHEISVERARAARRAAAAAVKFVASASALAALEKVNLSGLTGDDRNCIICYNEFGIKNPDGFIEYPVRLPKCKHVFGDRCLKQWLQDSDSCPYCRDKLPSEPKRNPPGDESVRRLIAQSRSSYALDPWIAAEASRIQVDSAIAVEREQQYQQFMQQRMARRDDGADEILARIRRRDDSEWGTSFNQPSMGLLPSRSMPRYRGRHSLSRTATQTASRPNGSSSFRSSRNSNMQSGPMRTPVHTNAPSFDESTTSQRRSITPHPTITGTATWTSQPQIQPMVSGRPSSLPTERSPLGEVSEVRADVLGPRSPSGSSNMSTSRLERPLSDNNNTSFGGWMMPTISNGRPVSETFINEMPPAQLQQLHDLNNQIPNNRLPPYMSNGGESDPHSHWYIH